MRFFAFKELFGTLRFRLTLWNTAVVFLIVLVTLFMLRASLQLTLTKNMDEFLIEEMDEIQGIMHHYSTNWKEVYFELNQKVQGHTRRHMFVQLFRPDGTLFWSTATSPDLHLPAPNLVLRKVITIDHYRLLHRKLRDDAWPELIIQVGIFTDQSERYLEHFTNNIFAIGSVILLLSPIGGYILAGRAISPLTRIINTTAKLSPAKLDERLPLRHTGDELDRLSRTINGLLDRIATYLEQNREFTANAAHELRSPLAAMQNSLEVALNADRSVEDYRECLTSVLEQCDDLRLLVNQLLLLAENDMGEVSGRKQTVRLDQLLVKAVDMFQGVAEVAGIELVTQHLEPIQVPGDADRLRQVLNNLIDNAIKFTPSAGKITIDLHVDSGLDQAVLSVKDNGQGIDPKDLKHVFERFFQGDKARQREKPSRGNGLGLSICQAIVAAHQGTIQVQSTLGSGSTFTVRLPSCARLAGSV